MNCVLAPATTRESTFTVTVPVSCTRLDTCALILPHARASMVTGVFMEICCVSSWFLT